MTAMRYTQCRLRRVDGHVDDAWIPSQYAKKGHYLKIKFRDRGWENGWMVSETFSSKEFGDLTEKERDYLRQREASDV